MDFWKKRVCTVRAPLFDLYFLPPPVPEGLNAHGSGPRLALEGGVAAWPLKRTPACRAPRQRVAGGCRFEVLRNLDPATRAGVRAESVTIDNAHLSVVLLR